MSAKGKRDPARPHITYFPEYVQGTEEWMAARRGMLTASEMKLIITPTLKAASNDRERTHLYELLAQRITSFVEPAYVGDHMIRGQVEEIAARNYYSEAYAPVTTMGFITNDRWGFPIGYSPDGLVGDDGLIECKSRLQKFQVQTIIEHGAIDGGRTIPPDFALQVQTGLLVSERSWLDLCSICGGLPMPVFRVYPDTKVQEAIVEASQSFERRLAKAWMDYRGFLRSGARFVSTERIPQEDIMA